MPVLKNPKHERFAQELARGKSASESYVLAGYAKNDGNSIRLKGNEKVSARVAELQQRVSERVIEKTAVTRADILAELKKIAMAQLGDDVVRASDKRAACVDYAKIEGWVIERHEHGAPGEFAAFENMDADELRAFIAARAEEAGVCEDDAPEGYRTGASGRSVN